MDTFAAPKPGSQTRAGQLQPVGSLSKAGGFKPRAGVKVGFLAELLARIRDFILLHVPLGNEDETGFIMEKPAACKAKERFVGRVTCMNIHTGLVSMAPNPDLVIAQPAGRRTVFPQPGNDRVVCGYCHATIVQNVRVNTHAHQSINCEACGAFNDLPPGCRHPDL